MIECSSISAGWCPICGDCTCPDPDNKNDDSCPLHSERGKHGEPDVYKTIWGTLIAEDL